MKKNLKVIVLLSLPLIILSGVLSIRAAGEQTALEPETGQLIAGAAAVTDPTASNGQYVDLLATPIENQPPQFGVNMHCNWGVESQFPNNSQTDPNRIAHYPPLTDTNGNGVFEAGENAFNTYGLSERRAVLDKFQQAGVKWVRMDVRWDTLEPTATNTVNNAQWYLKRMKFCMEEAQSRGMKVLFTIMGAPNWSHPGLTGTNQYPASETSVRTLMTQLAGHPFFKGKIDAWEMWNEPNLLNFLTPTDPVRYFNIILKPGAEATRIADPDALVVTGGVSSNDYDWHNTIYAQPNACQYFDVMNVHPYPSPGDETPLRPYTEVAPTGYKYRFTYITQIVQLVRTKEVGAGCNVDKPIWATEFGWRSFDGPAPGKPWFNGVGADLADGNDTTLQDDYAIQAMDYLKDNAQQVTVAFWYNDHNRYSLPDPEPDNYLGLLSRFSADGGYKEKNVYKKLKQYYTGQ